MTVKPLQNVVTLFTTSDPTTGAAVDADALPTGTLYVNGALDATAVTVTPVVTGVYTAACTLPALGVGDGVALRVAATVAGVAAEGVVWQDAVDTKRVSDLNDEVIGTGAGLTALGDARLAHLDADVSSRSAPGDAMALTAAAVDAIIDETIEGTITMRQLLRILLAVMAGLASGGGTNTIRYRDLADVLDRVVMTVDAMGNRTHVTLNGA